MSWAGYLDDEAFRSGLRCVSSYMLQFLQLSQLFHVPLLFTMKKLFDFQLKCTSFRQLYPSSWIFSWRITHLGLFVTFMMILRVAFWKARRELVSVSRSTVTKRFEGWIYYFCHVHEIIFFTNFMAILLLLVLFFLPKLEIFNHSDVLILCYYIHHYF